MNNNSLAGYCVGFESESESQIEVEVEIWIASFGGWKLFRKRLSMEVRVEVSIS